MSIVSAIRFWLSRGKGRLHFHSLSEKGPVRKENQDHFHVSSDRRLFCVADGMGGGEGGAKASEIACSAVACGDDGARDFTSRISRISRSIIKANSDIRIYARQAGYRQMATTVTVLAFDEKAQCAVIGYVGDSRVYRYRNGKLSQLTHDHTLAGELGRRTIPQSLLERFSAGADRLSHILTRAVGIEADIQTEWRKVDVQDGDMFLVCTDGVYDMAGEDGMAAAFATSGGVCKTAAEALADAIVAAGAMDNYTMIVVKAERGG